MIKRLLLLLFLFGAAFAPTSFGQQNSAAMLAAPKGYMRVTVNTTIPAGQVLFWPGVEVATGVTLTVNGILMTYILTGPGTVAGTGTIIGL